MTEEEAKTKWCPMVRFHVSRSGVVYDNKPITPENYNGATDDSSNCIGSGCMAWRNHRNDFISMAGGSSIEFEDNQDGGYCGLAGKP